ncbi:MAG: hypothetical protein A2987_03015 [Omnitrophica bacterium RIFCSPLOWO2_01_FULL_45_10]|nr:MAG: hypothetical protein A2987_03015 [Omnitrophica bacterium RIFCSPLOWO2_01_FULL_45_10]
MLKKLKSKALFVMVITLFWALSISVPSYAKGQGKNGGHGMSKGAVSEKDKTQGTNEGAMPPGLAKKDKMPYGLEKKDKTPAGWSKGEKRGWKKQMKKEKKKEKMEKKDGAEVEKDEKEKK